MKRKLDVLVAEHIEGENTADGAGAVRILDKAGYLLMGTDRDEIFCNYDFNIAVAKTALLAIWIAALQAVGVPEAEIREALDE